MRRQFALAASRSAASYCVFGRVAVVAFAAKQLRMFSATPFNLAPVSAPVGHSSPHASSPSDHLNSTNTVPTPSSEAHTFVVTRVKNGILTALTPDGKRVLLLRRNAVGRLSGSWNDVAEGTELKAASLRRSTVKGYCTHIALHIGFASDSLPSSIDPAENSIVDAPLPVRILPDLCGVDVMITHVLDGDMSTAIAIDETIKTRFLIRESFAVGTRVTVDAKGNVKWDQYEAINVSVVAPPVLREKVEVVLTQLDRSSTAIARWIDAAGAIHRVVVPRNLIDPAVGMGATLVVDFVSFQPSSKLDRVTKVHSTNGATAPVDENDLPWQTFLVLHVNVEQDYAVIASFDPVHLDRVSSRHLNGTGDKLQGSTIRAVATRSANGHRIRVTRVGETAPPEYVTVRTCHVTEQCKDHVVLEGSNGERIIAFQTEETPIRIGTKFHQPLCVRVPGFDSIVAVQLVNTTNPVLREVHGRYNGDGGSRHEVFLVPNTGTGEHDLIGATPLLVRMSKKATPKRGELTVGDTLICNVAAGRDIKLFVSSWRFGVNLENVPSLAELKNAVARVKANQRNDSTATTSSDDATLINVAHGTEATVTSAEGETGLVFVPVLQTTLPFDSKSFTAGSRQLSLSPNANITADIMMDAKGTMIVRNIRE